MKEHLLKNRIDQQKRASIRFNTFMDKHQTITLLSEYVRTRTKVDVQCKECKHKWSATPNKILQGRACPKCCNERTRVRCVDTTVESRLMKKGIKLIGEYKNASTPVEMECVEGHRWITVTDSILRANGTGCPSCAKYGFKKDKPAILYYISINKTHYKIGVTNNTINKRYSGVDSKIIEVLALRNYAKGADALIAEREILTKYKKFNYEGPRLLKGAANTEIFTCPIDFG